MRWQMGRRSENIEDRRGISPGVAVGGGLGTIVLVVVALFLGIDPSVVLQGTSDPQVAPPAAQRTGPPPDADKQLKDFVAVVLGDTEETWREIFRRMKREYRDPTLVLFTGVVRSACGTAQTAAGPFYCPGDQKVYLDLAFFRELRDRFRAPGEFAQAYVVAHEVGHHVQTLLGISERVRGLQARQGERGANALSVRHGAPGRLLRRRVGEQRQSLATDPREGGHRAGARGGGGHRRRPPAEAVAGARGAGRLHARQLGAARELVQARARVGRRAAVRHLRGARALARRHPAGRTIIVRD